MSVFLLCVYSAGIGRTGCFIATSIGIQQLREEHMVDVLGIVCSMRLDRWIQLLKFSRDLYLENPFFL